MASDVQRGLDHGPTIFTYYYPLCDSDARSARQRLLDLGWAEWAEITLADLDRIHDDLRVTFRIKAPDAKEPLFDKGGRMIGRATSGYYGHCLGKSLAIGYTRAEFGQVGTELAIEILGERKQATVLRESPYDPENLELRA